jgi:predicted dehydrogenase
LNGFKRSTTRRQFFFSTVSAISAVPVFGGSAAGNIRIAVIGVHGRGRDHIAGFQGVRDAEVVLLCDPDENVLRSRASHFESKYGRKVETEVDLRRVLERKDIDAVSIATPNHWHALAAIWACQAGKDVYVEKPGSHNLYEGRKLVEAAHKYDRIVQHGVQLRSSEALQEAVALLRKGVIGDVYMARGLVYRSRASIGKKQDTATPSGLNYDLWQGPASSRPFNPNIVHYNWHWRWPYGNGEIGNQGIHETDMCMWGLGMTTLPTTISAVGGKYLWDDDKETPEVLTARYQFPSNKMIGMEIRPWAGHAEEGIPVGNIFYGKDGILLVKGYNEFKVLLGKNREPGPKGHAGGNHFANFIEAVRSRNRAMQNGPVETAHTSSGLAHLANISYRLQRKLQFDPEAERFVGDEKANCLLGREYRESFVVPERV